MGWVSGRCAFYGDRPPMKRRVVNVYAFLLGLTLAAALLLPASASASTFYRFQSGSYLAEGTAAALPTTVCEDVGSFRDGAYNGALYAAVGGGSAISVYCNYKIGAYNYFNQLVGQAILIDGVCPSPLVDVGGVCQEPTPCTAGAGQVVSSGMYDLGTDENATPPTTTCDGSCELSYTGSGVVARQMVGGEYHYFSEGSYTMTSASCSGSSTALSGSSGLPPPTCDSATQDQGTVNGQTVCLEKTKTDTTTKTPPVVDPVTGDSTQTTTTTHDDGSTTTTTETTHTDGSVTTTVVDNAAPADSFCQANPTDPSCAPTDDICAQRPDTLGCSELGTVADVALGTEERGLTSITPATVGGAGSCPADLTADFMGQPLVFSWALPCQAAEWLRPLVLAFTWLAAGVIFIGGVRQ
jgi:hypothetical protein